jgi:hypothetical protein
MLKCNHCNLNQSNTFVPEYYYKSVFRSKDNKYKYIDELVGNTVGNTYGFKRVATISHPYQIYNNGFNIILESHEVDNDLRDLMIITYEVKKFIEVKGIKTNVIVNRNRVYDKDEEKYEHQHAWLIPTDMSLFINLICRIDKKIPTKGLYPKLYPKAKGIMSLDEYNKKYRNDPLWRKKGYDFYSTFCRKKHSLTPSAEDNTITIKKNILKCNYLNDMEKYVQNQISFYIFCKDNSTCISSSKNIRITINESDNTLNYKLIDTEDDKCGSDKMGTSYGTSSDTSSGTSSDTSY